MKYKRPAAVGVAVATALALAACGGSSGSSSSSGGAASSTSASTSSSTASGGAPKEGGTIKIGTVGPDSYDPQEYETVQADSALHLVYEGLLAFKDATGQASTELIPAMAESIPTPTNNGKMYVFQIRPNLHYSDGEPVKASDVVNMVKRNLFLGGPFSSFYDDIVGATDYANAKKANAPLKGMIADDATGKLTINLVDAGHTRAVRVRDRRSGSRPGEQGAVQEHDRQPVPG